MADEHVCSYPRTCEGDETLACEECGAIIVCNGCPDCYNPNDPDVAYERHVERQLERE